MKPVSTPPIAASVVARPRAILAAIILTASAGTLITHVAIAAAAKAPVSATVAPVPAAPFDAPLVRAPLDPPLDVTGGYCEYRIGHFHAGFDFGTGKRTGAPVYAPLGGHVERIRTSGVGYGRSLYVRTHDGRLLQFGHLDAFVEPIASYVAFVQDSSGQYEHDLWPAADRFPIKARQQIAWTGQSGAGGPHLHFEIRRGDMAYHPQRAGLEITDTRAPTLARLTLEPLDDDSHVNGSTAPVTIDLGADPETLAVRGKVRAIVDARDGVWSGVDRMAPWSTAIAWDGNEVECRFDSVSWATDMAEGDFVYDAGRVRGEKGIVLWAPAGFRPRAIRTNVRAHEDAGTIVVREGDAPRMVRLTARDVTGNSTERHVVLIAAQERRRFAIREGVPGATAASMRSELTALPNTHLRVRCIGIPDTVRDVVVGWNAIDARARTASRSGRAWTAVLQWGMNVAAEGAFVARGVDARGAPWEARSQALTISSGTGDSTGAEALRWRIEREATFDGAIVARDASDTPPAPPAELKRVQLLGRLVPESLVLRQSIALYTMRPPANAGRHVGLYRHDGADWVWVAKQDDPDRARFTARTRSLGWFALMSDTLAPRITLRAPVTLAGRGNYSKWMIEAAIAEGGSGVDARASYFIVDGKRVAAEWDSEADVLRWRPLKRPAQGTHRYSVVVADRAGNSRVRSGTFAIKG